MYFHLNLSRKFFIRIKGTNVDVTIYHTHINFIKMKRNSRKEDISTSLIKKIL